MARFDWVFPGYSQARNTQLARRPQKRVRTSVIALVPPGEGIRARLATTGVSRVVVGGDAFQTIVTRRGSESVSLTSPIEATGLFELLPERGDMLYPFEGMGVDAPWEFRMYRAANPINFNTIADVLVTFEYTALESFDYERQVIDSMPPLLHGERAFSFKYGLPDQWYDLRNGMYSVDFRLTEGDFPRLAQLKVENVTVMLVHKDGAAIPMALPVTLLHDDGTGEVGGLGTANGYGVVSTRTQGSSSNLLNLYQSNPGLIDDIKWKLPSGQWTLDVAGTATALGIASGDIVDVLVIVGYVGDSPQY